jgi:hypothetical protein
VAMGWGMQRTPSILLGILSRLNDKVARLVHIASKEFPGLWDKHAEDSWLDLTGYGILAMMVSRGTFQLPLVEGEDECIRSDDLPT